MAAFSSVAPFAKQLALMLLGLAGVSFLIFFHELGHFLFCKLFGIRTPSFSIGFGPRLLTKKIGDTTFALSAIPMGGYVEIAGAEEVGQGDQKYAYSTGQDSFRSKPYYQKLLVLLGGIVFNMLFAYAALTALFRTGVQPTPLLYPHNASATIDTVVPESSAAQAGIKPGDSIVALNGNLVNNNVPQLLTTFRSNPDKQIQLTIERDGHQQVIPVTLKAQETALGRLGSLGVIFTQHAVPPMSLAQALKRAWTTTIFMSRQTIDGFKSLRKSTAGLGGPLMIIAQAAQGAQSGFKIFMLFLIFISINLAILNLIPLPIFDGGQIVVYTIEALAGRPLPDSVKVGIHYACWILIVGLIFFLTYKDIKTLFFK